MPAALKRVREKGVPSFLWRSVPDEAKLAALPEGERIVGETNARQVFHRLAGCWTYWGWKGGYFSSEADARAFYDEICYMLADADGARRTARSGSTPACTGPTASTARRRGTTTSTPRPAR